MTRRTFLRVLSSAAVAVSVAPLVPDWIAPVVEAGPRWDLGVAGPLTYEMLEQAYQSCVIGVHHPTMGVCSRSVARLMGLVYDVEMEEAA